MPHQAGNPKDIMFNDQKLELGKFFKNPFADETDRMGHSDLGPGHAHFQIIGGIAGRGGGRGYTGPFSPEVNAKGQAVRFTGGVNGVIEAVAKS